VTAAAAGREAVDGVLLLDKPRGLTSQQAVARAKWLFNARKAGHTGTLDPMADGLLPIGFGEATKFSQFLLDADKRYLATLRLGVSTTTGDAEGEVTGESVVAVTRAQIDEVVQGFTGPQRQLPPMHAAIKVGGKPLYAYARAGVTIERETRSIVIKSIQVIDYKDDFLIIRVSCSKGTYIRVLAEDIGSALGCGAHLTALTREAAGNLGLDQAVSLAELEAMSLPQRLDKMRPVDTFAAGLPRLDVAVDQERRLLMGQVANIGEPGSSGLHRLYGAGGDFFGVGELTAGVLLARRLLARAAAAVSGPTNSLSNPAVTE
jgi:tRNA pseudouridine55 synthase